MIETLPQLIDKLREIPDDKWCVDLLNNGAGQRCVIGHMIKMRVQPNPWEFLRSLGVPDTDLIEVNNGGRYDDQRDKSGTATKRRAIEFLENVQKQQTIEVEQVPHSE